MLPTLTAIASTKEDDEGVIVPPMLSCFTTTKSNTPIVVSNLFSIGTAVLGSTQKPIEIFSDFSNVDLIALIDTLSNTATLEGKVSDISGSHSTKGYVAMNHLVVFISCNGKDANSENEGGDHELD